MYPVNPVFEFFAAYVREAYRTSQEPHFPVDGVQSGFKKAKRCAPHSLIIPGISPTFYFNQMKC